jgi:hypothetical protein
MSKRGEQGVTLLTPSHSVRLPCDRQRASITVIDPPLISITDESVWIRERCEAVQTHQCAAHEVTDGYTAVSQKLAEVPIAVAEPVLPVYSIIRSKNRSPAGYVWRVIVPQHRGDQQMLGLCESGHTRADVSVAEEPALGSGRIIIPVLHPHSRDGGGNRYLVFECGCNGP